MIDEQTEPPRPLMTGYVRGNAPVDQQIKCSLLLNGDRDRWMSICGAGMLLSGQSTIKIKICLGNVLADPPGPWYDGFLPWPQWPITRLSRRVSTGRS
ncbi:hypothetical protein PQR39_45610, partial [Paraburkholderia sediminicola]|uniref:hypothetical protein n=1 Tax=Paraburkholderia sediminicola TaxID=458836 RepID=UPI0038B8C2C4